MKELQAKLKLPKLPYQIECFDNSNISGTDAVAGCIVYKGMKPTRKDYRKYNIKTVEGPGRLCIHAGGGKAPVQPYDRRRNTASRPYYYRWW